MRRAGRPLLFITSPLFPSLSVKADLSALQLTDSALHKQNFLNTGYTNTAKHRRKCSASEARISKHWASDLPHNSSGNRHYCRDVPDGRRLLLTSPTATSTSPYSHAVLSLRQLSQLSFQLCLKYKLKGDSQRCISLIKVRTHTTKGWHCQKGSCCILWIPPSFQALVWYSSCLSISVDILHITKRKCLMLRARPWKLSILNEWRAHY